MSNEDLSKEHLAKDEINQIITDFNQLNFQLADIKDHRITQIIDDFNKLSFKLVNMSEPDKMYWLRYCYQRGTKDKKDDNKLAYTNNSDEMYWLGCRYEYGIGVEKDEYKAFIYYHKSAGMNNSNGMYQVGYCYYLGIGVEIDKHKAFTYYLKSAETGNLMGIWKTAVCYYYAICGVEKNASKCYEMIKNDPYATLLPISHYGTYDCLPLRNSKYEKCAHCNEINTKPTWCQTCDPDIATRWTSGNKDVDDCIKMFQQRTMKYEEIIEWIPFDRLSNVKEIGKGGFGSVYSTIWLDGIRKIEEIKIDKDNCSYKRSREQNSIVALKTLSGSLNEFENHTKCNQKGSKLKIYGLTQNSNNEYLMVFQYADSGSLHRFLRTNFQDLTWKIKLQILLDISQDLTKIHSAGYIHADFHSGNILQHKGISTTLQSYVSDLGLSKKKDKKDENDSGDIYGVLPYVAPEVLLGLGFTQAADIYGLGVIMSEMSTGQRPFDGHDFDLKLATKICKGLQPEFGPGAPDCYIELAKRCMDSDPKKRPSISNIQASLEKWHKSIEISEPFFDADKAAKKLPKVSPKHPDIMYTSKIINTQRISDAIKKDLEET